MIKKIVGMVWKVLGMPYNILKSVIMYSYVQVIRLFNNGWKLSKVLVSLPVKILSYVLGLIKKIKFKKIGKWILDVLKESIAQIFTLLGFFIACFTFVLLN